MFLGPFKRARSQVVARNLSQIVKAEGTEPGLQVRSSLLFFALHVLSWGVIAIQGLPLYGFFHCFLSDGSRWGVSLIWEGAPLFGFKKGDKGKEAVPGWRGRVFYCMQPFWSLYFIYFVYLPYPP